MSLNSIETVVSLCHRSESMIFIWREGEQKKGEEKRQIICWNAWKLIVTSVFLRQLCVIYSWFRKRKKEARKGRRKNTLYSMSIHQMDLVRCHIARDDKSCVCYKNINVYPFNVILEHTFLCSSLPHTPPYRHAKRFDNINSLIKCTVFYFAWSSHSHERKSGSFVSILILSMWTRVTYTLTRTYLHFFVVVMYLHTARHY